MNKEEFLIAEGLKVQAVHLAQWKSMLKADLYQKLLDHIFKQNQKSMKTGYDVFRGTDLDSWVQNNLMEKIQPAPHIHNFFEIPVCRIGYGFRTIKVYANNQVEAEQIALDTAGDYEFSERTADYEIEGGSSSQAVTENELSQIEHGVISIERATGISCSEIWRAIRPTFTGNNTNATNLKDVVSSMDCCFDDGEPYPEIIFTK